MMAYGLSKISMNEKEREEREKEDIGGLADEVSRENEKNAKLLSSKAEHIEEQYLADAKPYLACLADSHDSDSIETDLLQAEEQTRAKEEHFRKVAVEHTGPKLDPPKRVGTKKILSYSEMAGFVPYDTSSSETEKICRSFRGQLMKGMAPRIDFLVKETELPKESIEGYLNSAPWIRKDDSSPAGIVVYLPVEALA